MTAQLFDRPGRPDEEGGFDELYRLVQPRLLAYVRRTCPGVDAEEVAAETMLRLYESFDRLDPQRSVWPWLIVVARRVAVDAYRAQTHCVPDSDTVLEMLGSRGRGGLDSEVLRKESSALMDQAIRFLPKDEAKVLTMRLDLELSHQDIAEELGCSPELARQQFRRARLKVVQRFVQMGGEYGVSGLVAVFAWVGRQARRQGQAATTWPALVGAAVVAAALGPAVLDHGADEAGIRSEHPGVVIAPSVRVVSVETWSDLDEPSRQARPAATPDVVTPVSLPIAVESRAVVAAKPFAPGASDFEAVKVHTPAGSVYVEGGGTNSESQRVVCTVPVVDCEP